MTAKITGYLLLSLGLLVIGYSGYSIYQVFTKQISPIQLFSLRPVTLDISSLLPPDLPLVQKPAPAELVSASDLNFLSNLTAHYLLMSFFVSIGFKISSLGIQLLRPIEVKLQDGAKNS